MKTKHTPGPWEIRHNDFDMHGVVSVPSGVEVIELLPVGTETQRANACLIAAAPDLLALLVELKSAIDAGHGPTDGGELWCGINFNGEDFMDRVSAAIAKAEGEQEGGE